MLRIKSVSIAAVSFLFLASAATSSYSQVFLDKLEAAVRQHMEASPELPGQREVIEELPLPKSKDPQSGNSGSGNSSLDSRYPQTNLPTEVPQEPLSLEPSGDDFSAPRSQGVYLGLEAAEVSGGGLGVNVAQVTEGSPAWKSGIKVNDRIVAINGNAIANLDDMVGHISVAAPGDVMRFLVARNGRNMEIVAVLMGRELAAKIAEKAYGTPMPPPTAERQDAPKPWLGVMASDLTEAFRQQFRIATFKGAAVTQVSKGSPAARAGIMPGDVIIEANGRPIQSSADLTNWIQESKPGESYEFVVQRGAIARVVEVVMRVKTIDSTRSSDSAVTSNLQATPNILSGTEDAPPSNAAEDLNPVQPLEFSALSPELSELEKEKLRADTLQSEVDVLREQLRESESKLQDMQKRMNQLLEVLQK